MLIEAAIGGDAPNLAGRLHQAQRNRKSRGDAFLRGFRAEIAGCGANGIANFFGTESGRLDRAENGCAQFVHLFVSHTERARLAHFGIGGELLPHSKSDGVVAFWDNVGTAARAGQFMNLRA